MFGLAAPVTMVTRRILVVMRLQSACKGTEQTYHNPKLCVVLMRFLAKNSDFTPLFLGYGRIFGNLSLFYDRIFGIIINFALKKVINSKIHVIFQKTHRPKTP